MGWSEGKALGGDVFANTNGVLPSANGRIWYEADVGVDYTMSRSNFPLKRRSKTMNCINMICLYLKKYLTDEQFENIFYDYIEDFQNSLEEDMYLNVLSTNFSAKQEKISLETELYNYVLENYDSVYENINDAYVERIIDSNKEDIVVEILKNKYQKKEEVDIDCSMINTRSELIDAIKRALQYPHFCGDNWDAIEDLIYDIILPQKLILHNWHEVEKRIPQDTATLKSILDKYNNGRCVVIYT